MPGLSKVIVLDPDGRAGRQIQLGFQREGVPAEVASVPIDPAKLEIPGDDAGLVVVGGSDARALDLLRRTRGLLEAGHIDAPIVFAGRGVRRTDAEAAGADEVVLQPAYLRDVVTIGRLLRGQPATHRAHLVGSLGEVCGVFTLVRALATLGRSAVLTLIRGLRRGEVRFYHGEVTSAQVGLNHGQAALHQLLLWTDARFDFRHEDVVRRQQIPLEHDELFADAERFLAGVRDSSGKLSPAMVLEQDVARVQMLGKQIPTEVHGVLRMFDGHRVLADVLEDSPYRVFETLRVSQLALEVGLLRIATGPRPRATWRAVLALEEWLVGSEPPRDDDAPRESGPIPAQAQAQAQAPRMKGSKRRRKRKRASTPVAMATAVAKPDIDWGLLVPRVVGAEVGPLSGVVPASYAAGEIGREKLETVMDPGARERMFAPEPSVVFDEHRERAELDAAARADAEAEEARRIAVLEKATQARADAEGEAAEETRRLGVLEKAAETRRLAEEAEREQRDLDEAADRLRAAAERERDRAREESEARQIADQARARAEAQARPPDADAEREAKTAEARAIASTVSGSQPELSAQAIADEAQAIEPIAITETIAPAPTAPVVESATAPEPSILVAAAAAPEAEALDEPSDGVVRTRIATAETAPTSRRAPPGAIPDDDRPDDTTGELVIPTAAGTQEPAVEEPSILVNDLAAVHSAVSAVAAHDATEPAPGTVASPLRHAEVTAVQYDAAQAFSELEEDFFAAGQAQTKPPRGADPGDTFADLDEGYQPIGFWDRLRGKKPRR